MQPTTPRQDWARLACPMLLLVAGLYALLHPYEGLIHDARLYTLQALNYLHPELYANDVFLKYGSQDSYTLFTPLYAGAITLLGVERAASFLTLLSVAALLSGAWLLARTLMPARPAWLGLGLFVLIPGFYGEGIVFSVLEEFITPRMLSEAFALFAIAFWLKERRTLSVVALAAATLVHPIMAFPAIVFVVILEWGLSRWRLLSALTLIGLVGASLAVVGWIPLSRWQFDDLWQPVAHWAPHLMLSEWTGSDWARVATVLTTLIFAARVLPSRGRQVALAMLVTCCLLLLLAWIGGDLLRIVLIVQGQAWRCLWLATAAAVLLLPWVAAHCWTDSRLRRCGAVLLISSWIAGHQSLSLLFSIPALLALTMSGREFAQWALRLVDRAVWILVAVLVICMTAVTWTDDIAKPVSDAYAAPWFKALRVLCEDRILPAAILIAIWYATTFARSRLHAIAIALLAAIPLALLAPQAKTAWLRQQYSQEAHAAFGPWRSLIPPGADVLWAIRLITGSDPASVWLLLERPSYFSSVQFNSGLFSRDAAMELMRRHKAIPKSLPTEQPVRVVFKDRGIVAPTCAEVPTRYVVSETQIVDAEIVPAPDNAPPPFDRLQLQICP